MPHMQVRVGLGSASSTITGAGAMMLTPIEVDPLDLKQGALVELLDLLAENNYDLATAGGDSIEGGGEFVFSLKDRGEDESDEDRPYREVAELLKSNGYRNVRLIKPRLCEVENEAGALRDCLRELVTDGIRIDEIYVGVPLPSGKIPVQVTTIRTI
jgi:hypothetical protein